MSLANVDRFENSNCNHNNNNHNGSVVANGTNKNIKLLCKRNIDFDGNGNNKVARRQNENGAEQETAAENEQQKQQQNGEDWHPTNGTRYLNTPFLFKRKYTRKYIWGVVVAASNVVLSLSYCRIFC